MKGRDLSEIIYKNLNTILFNWLLEQPRHCQNANAFDGAFLFLLEKGKRGVSQMKNGIKITGLDKLIGKLKDNTNLDDVRNVVRLNGAEMQEKAMRYAPVKTGHLKRSITLASDLEDRGLSIKIVPTAEYASYVEYGTRFMYTQPFIRPALYFQRKQFIKDMKRLMQ